MPSLTRRTGSDISVCRAAIAQHDVERCRAVVVEVRRARREAARSVKSEVNVPAVSMANQRSTFAKRRREQGLQDRARAKQLRRAARRNEPRPVSGPQIAWDEAVRPPDGDDAETLTDAPDDPVVEDDPPA